MPKMTSENPKMTLRQRYQHFVESHDRYRTAETHVLKYQTVYVAAGASAAMFLMCRTSAKPATIINNVAPNIAPVISPTISPVISNVVNNGGYTRKIVRCLETEEMWPSMKAAAEATGNHLVMMSKHCNGHVDSLNGLHYVIDGLAAA